MEKKDWIKHVFFYFIFFFSFVTVLFGSSAFDELFLSLKLFTILNLFLCAYACFFLSLSVFVGINVHERERLEKQFQTEQKYYFKPFRFITLNAKPILAFEMLDDGKTAATNFLDGK